MDHERDCMTQDLALKPQPTVVSTNEISARSGDTDHVAGSVSLSALRMFPYADTSASDLIYLGDSCTGNDAQVSGVLRIAALEQSPRQELDIDEAKSRPELGASPMTDWIVHLKQGNFTEAAIAFPGALVALGMLNPRGSRGGSIPSVNQLPKRAVVANVARTGIAKVVALESGLPAGAKNVRVDGQNRWVTYWIGDRQRIRFRADQAKTSNEVAPGRNYTSETEVRLNPTGYPVVIEGTHRAIGAAQGQQIPRALGGVPGQPGVLDFEFNPTVHTKNGRRIDKLKIDYDFPDVSAAKVARMREVRDALRWGDVD